MNQYKILKEIPWYSVWEIVSEVDLSAYNPSIYPDWFELLPTTDWRWIPTTNMYTYNESWEITRVILSWDYLNKLSLWMYYKTAAQAATYIKYRKKLKEIEDKYWVPDVADFNFYILDPTTNLYSLSTWVFWYLEYENWIIVTWDASPTEIWELEVLLSDYIATLEDIYYNH